MANSSALSAEPELYVEERLCYALINGPLEQSGGLLDALEEVDVRFTRQRTLLHVGVSLGKLDWVEELLARGADPELMDGSHITAVSSAEEMLRRFPEDSDRRQVMSLVRLVHRRDQVMRRRLETSSGRSAVSSTLPVLQTEHMSAIAALSSSVDAQNEEMRSLRAEIKSSLKELKGQVCGRDALLQCLEAAVTSSAEQLTSLNGRLQGETPLGAMGTTLETPLPQSNMADERRVCVDGMMRRTEVVYGGEEGVRLVRRLYERLYDEDDATACLLKFLHRESRFMAKVDCGCWNIGRMKERFVDLDGDVQSGSGCISFAEFSSNTVYLGAKVGVYFSEEYVAECFACALARMSLHLCFNNGGKPYEVRDGVHEAEWKRVFEEAREKRKRGGSLHGWVLWAFNMNTQTAKDCLLAASVPEIIARYGSTEGTRILRQQVPRLFRYYKEHVVSTLLSKARVCQLHFDRDEVLWETTYFDERSGKIVTAPLFRPRLKESAIPHVLLEKSWKIEYALQLEIHV